MSDEQWGPWIDHDGQGCPCKGQYVHVIRADGVENEYVAWTQIIMPNKADTDPKTSYWAWVYPEGKKIIRYRIRKPKGLTMLESILAEVETKQPKVYVDVEV